MKILILLLSASLFLSTFNSYQEQESPELKEASELSDSVIKLVNQQRFDEALPQAKRALQIREKLLPRTDPRVLASLHRLGDLYLSRRDYDAARQTFERLLKALEERFGPEAWNIGATLDRLAILYSLDRDFRKAEETYLRAVAVREKYYGAENVMTAEPVFQLAQFYRRQKQFEQALANYKRTLTIYSRVSGVNSPEFQRASSGITCLAYDSDNKAFHEELKNIRKQFDPVGESPDPAAVLNGMALKLAKPDYPLAAAERRLQGIVIVQVEIDEVGNVISASDMCQGPPYLSESAVKAALKSRFTPTKLSGMPIKVKGVIQYRFVQQ